MVVDGVELVRRYHADLPVQLVTLSSASTPHTVTTKGENSLCLSLSERFPLSPSCEVLKYLEHGVLSRRLKQTAIRASVCA
jgi:hypothetical protein